MIKLIVGIVSSFYFQVLTIVVTIVTRPLQYVRTLTVIHFVDSNVQITVALHAINFAMVRPFSREQNFHLNEIIYNQIELLFNQQVLIIAVMEVMKII